MKLEEIEALWEKHSKIDSTELAKESLEISELHNKFFKIVVREKMAHSQLEADYKRLYKVKVEYYMGSLDQETLKERGWEPFRLRVMKDNLSTYLNGDNDLIELSLKIKFQLEKVELLDSIIKQISARTYYIKNAIDFMKFTNGLNF